MNPDDKELKNFIAKTQPMLWKLQDENKQLRSDYEGQIEEANRFLVERDRWKENAEIARAAADMLEAERDRLAKQLSRAHDDESIERERAERLAADLDTATRLAMRQRARVEELEKALLSVAEMDFGPEFRERIRALLDKERT